MTTSQAIVLCRRGAPRDEGRVLSKARGTQCNPDGRGAEAELAPCPRAPDPSLQQATPLHCLRESHLCPEEPGSVQEARGCATPFRKHFQGCGLVWERQVLFVFLCNTDNCREGQQTEFIQRRMPAEGWATG